MDQFAPSLRAYAGTEALTSSACIQEQIKSLLTGLMLSTPPLVRAQLSEALSVISSHDFPRKWATLLPELIERLKSGDAATVHVSIPMR